VNVVLLDEARRRFEAADAWWHEHRDAKDLLIDEFEQALQHLSRAPDSGQRYRWVRGKLIRRWLIKKTGHHIYYSYDSPLDRLEIHSLWGARRGRGPQL